MKEGMVLFRILVSVVLVGVAFVRAWAVDVGFLRELVAVPSVSEDIPQINRAMRMTRTYLEKRGVCCVMETMPDGHEILYASTTPGKGHDFVLAPHMDVVQAKGPEAFSMKQDGDKVMGRGVRDCKGRVVAVAAVLCELVGTGASVGCIFGADEEIGGDSTAWMVGKGYGPKKMAIVTDSSFYDRLAYAQKGHTLFIVKGRGRGGHSSQPWLSDDIIMKMARASVTVRDAWDRRHPLADDTWSDVLVPTRVIADGGAMNIIPDDFDMVWDLRSVTPTAKDEAFDLLKSVMGCEVEVFRHSPPVVSDPKNPLMERLRRVMGETLGRDVPFDRMGAATDAYCFVPCGVPVALVGTRGHGAHTENEYDYISSMEELKTYLVKFLCGCGSDAASVEVPRMPVRGLCAHRGDAAAFPENTVSAIEAAARKGAAMVEIDVKRCKTGELVLMHDATVDRTTTGSGKVSSLTFDEIRALDAGVKKDAKFAGTKVPTFDEAIDCLPKAGIWINVHCKGVVTVKTVVRKLKEKGRLHQAFIAGREKIIHAAREVEPGIRASLFMTNPEGRGKTWTEDGIRAYVEYAGREHSDYLQLGNALIDAPAYREFRAHGGKVIYCFGNDEESIRRIAAFGFEFALTDNLDAMLPHFPTAFAECAL